MKLVFFTRHALEKIFKEKLSEEDAIQAVQNGVRKQEGKTKFKAILKRREYSVIAVCCEYEDHVLVITVLKSKGETTW